MIEKPEQDVTERAQVSAILAACAIIGLGLFLFLIGIGIGIDVGDAVLAERG